MRGDREKERERERELERERERDSEIVKSSENRGQPTRPGLCARVLGLAPGENLCFSPSPRRRRRERQRERERERERKGGMEADIGHGRPQGAVCCACSAEQGNGRSQDTIVSSKVISLRSIESVFQTCPPKGCTCEGACVLSALV